jgi:ferritin-like metal-binding protein YciE
MPAKSLHDLFIEELRDMYDGEKRLTKAIPKMAKAATSPELRTAFTNHLRETEKQVTRLEQVFRTIGEKPRGKKCDGIMGIVEEGNTMMQELDRGPVLDAALIGGAQKVEHYEIASYGTLAYFADLMGHERAKELLGDTLEEEKAADEKLSTIAKSKVNRQALAGHGSESSETMGVGMPRTGRRMASFAMANDEEPAPRRSSSRRGSSGSTSSRSRSRSKRVRR